MATRLDGTPSHLIGDLEELEAAKQVERELDGVDHQGIPIAIVRKALRHEIDRVLEVAHKLPKRKRRYLRGAQLPKVTSEDALFVPAALKHWRAVHGLTQRQASARIGYSVDSNPWKDWEQSTSRLPSYRALLSIIASTGMTRISSDLVVQQPIELPMRSEPRVFERRMAQRLRRA